MLLLNKTKGLFGEDATGYLFMLLATNGWVFAIYLVSNDPRITTFHLSLARGICTIVISYVLLRVYDFQMDFKKDLKLLNTRNIVIAVHGFSLIGAVNYLELPIVYTIFNSGPVFIFIFDYFVSKVTVTPRQLAGIIVSCLGLTLAINSRLIYFLLGIHEELHSSFKYVECSLSVKLLISCYLLAINAAWGYVLVLSKQLKQANAIHTNLHLGIVLTLLSTILMMVYPVPAVFTFSLQLDVFKIATIVSISSWLANGSYFLSKKTGNLSLINFSSVISSYLVSILRYDELPNALGVLGSVGIGIGMAFVLLK